jgi:tRNA G10  N-methylase Trm11
MKQIFILGRNPELSRAEIMAYAESRKLSPKEILFEENLLVVDLFREIDIQALGGTLFSGMVLSEGEESAVINYIEKEDLYDSDKFKYGFFGNGDEGVLKEKFKAEKRKAVLKHGHKRIKSQTGDDFEVPRADVYFFLSENKGVFYFGVLDKEYDYEGVKARDMEKPVRREELAISPRLSKILINLSGAKEGDLMLDPFCGIGGILIEGLIRGIKVYGVDKDSRAIKGAVENLSWLKQNFEIRSPYIVERRDALKVLDKKFDAVATETPLGKVLRHKPKKGEAIRIIRDFERMIVPILWRLREVKKPSGRIAITFPRIGDVGVDYDFVEEETGLRLVTGPIEESREKQFVGRDVVVWE